ncbi:hypothetical protein EDC01DRAFT_240055 [Geopyxis carbonaria]|nr:hypothetical protein EDC01DRAFT_240055 [Geopyxis carbonaria]
MPVFPLLSSGSDNEYAAAKKETRKLRRKNPPPSAYNHHQKLPSSSGSSAVSLSNNNQRPSSARPSSARSSRSFGGWLSRSSTSEARKSMDAGAGGSTHSGRSGSNQWRDEEEQRPPLPILNHESGSPTSYRTGGGGVSLTANNYSTNYSNGVGGHRGHGGVSLAAPPVPAPPVSRSARVDTHNNNSTAKQLPPSYRQYPDGKKPSALSAGLVIQDNQNATLKLAGRGSNVQESSARTSRSSGNVPPQSNGGRSNYPADQKPRAKTFPIDDEFLLPPTAPFAKPERPARESSGSPLLPPLPPFQAGDFGFESSSGSSSQESVEPLRMRTTEPIMKPPVKNPRRKSSRPSSLASIQSPVLSAEPSPVRSFTAEEYQAEISEDESSHPGVFHAVTADEPIVLPNSQRTSSQPSPEAMPEESQTKTTTQTRAVVPPPVNNRPRKSEERGSFLGGWKLAMKNFESTRESAAETKPDNRPIGVGSGGGWIQRRRGSFSSPRPPSAEKAQHKSYAQEYKEFRNTKSSHGGSGSSKHSSSDGARQPTTTTNTSTTTTFATTAAPAAQLTKASTEPPPTTPTLRRSTGSTRKSFMEKMRNVEARLQKRDNEPPAPVGTVDDKDLVSLEVAAKQMSMLETQLASGRPLSPPDSRDGIPAPLKIEKKGSAAVAPRNGYPPQPAPPPGHKSHKKTKSISPLRNEVGTVSPTPTAEAGAKLDKGKGRASAPEPMAPALVSRKSGGATRPPTPPKPIAKLFVICCRCKYWHDLPSAMYRGMVENGGATRCPYCLHGMETACCSGYTCVVYMHQRHH